MTERPVRDASDLPDHDYILPLPREQWGEAHCHVRYYACGERHVAIVGSLDDGVHVPKSYEPIARELLLKVIPPGREFVFIAYQPQKPWDREREFCELVYELDDSRRRPSEALLADPARGFPQLRPLPLEEVEALVGRPILRFPYGVYTRALAAASQEQPASRLFDLLVEADLCCPVHGLSPYGEYCAAGLDCYAERHRRGRRWRRPREPRRRRCDGAYMGAAGRIELLIEGTYSEPTPVFGFEGPDVGWGSTGSLAMEAATAILADYLGYLPRRDVRGRFVEEVVATLPSARFALSIGDLNDWYDRHNPASRRGLVVIAGPTDIDMGHGRAIGLADLIARRLTELGFDVYHAGRDAETPRWKASDHRLAGMVHASLRGALEASSLIVVPYDRDGLMLAADAVTAVRYAIRTDDVPVVIAHTGLDPDRLRQFHWLGCDLARVRRGPVPDITRVVQAVDHHRTAYEYVHAETSRSPLPTERPP